MLSLVTDMYGQGQYYIDIGVVSGEGGGVTRLPKFQDWGHLFLINFVSTLTGEGNRINNVV